MNDDVLTYLEEVLEDQRAANAAGYDRERALVELRSLAVDAAVALNRHALSADALWASPTTPEEHARLRSLVDRALPDTQEVPA